jgi:glycerate-2-kinase
VGSNRIALKAAAHLCRQSFTYAPFIMTNCLQGEAREVAHHIVELVIKEPSELVYNDKIACLFSDKSTFDAFQTFVKEHKHYCLLLGGETTVVMKNGAGKGGRCQELALAAALSINENNKDVSIGLLAAGSDGIDGPTDAAGAFAFKGMFINKDDIQRAHAALDKHDAYTYLNETNNGENLLKIGHTNTNVMDIIIVLVDRENNTS